MRRTIGTALVAMLALGLAGAPAEATPGGRGGERRTVNLLGTLTGVFSDAFMVDVEKANGPGRRYLRDNPGDAVVALGDRTRFHGPMRLVDGADDFQVGDAVRVKARLAGGVLVARRVELKLRGFESPPDAEAGHAEGIARTYRRP